MLASGRRRAGRSKLRIMLDILAAIEEDGGRSRFTRILTMSNMPYDRFSKYLEELESRGFLDDVKDDEGGRYLSLTPEGVKFTAELRRLEEFLRGLGLVL